MSYIIGKKLEMTQQFTKDGSVVPVTLIKVESNIVTQVKNHEKDGYFAVQVGTHVTNKKLNKSQQGHLKDLPNFADLVEFRMEKEVSLSKGDKVKLDEFQPGMDVDVTGISKGKGFAGVMKRHGFAGGKATHGNKDQQRMGGSIASQRQGKVIKGQRMAGRMGNDQVTVKNLKVVSVDLENSILALKGAVPGARGGLIRVRTSDRKTIWQS